MKLQMLLLKMCLVTQALELNETNTKALFRRAQAWQGLKEYSKALVTSAQAFLCLKRKIYQLYIYELQHAFLPP